MSLSLIQNFFSMCITIVTSWLFFAFLYLTTPLFLAYDVLFTIVSALVVLIISQLIFDRHIMSFPTELHGTVIEVVEVKPNSDVIKYGYLLHLLPNIIPLFFTGITIWLGVDKIITFGTIIAFTALALAIICSESVDLRPEQTLNPFAFLFGYKAYILKYNSLKKPAYIITQEYTETNEILVLTKSELRQEDLKYFDMEYLDLYKIDEGVYFLKGVKK